MKADSELAISVRTDIIQVCQKMKICSNNPNYSLNFIGLLRVVITPSVNDSKQSDEFQAIQTKKTKAKRKKKRNSFRRVYLLRHGIKSENKHVKLTIFNGFAHEILPGDAV